MMLPLFFGQAVWTCEPEMPGSPFNILHLVEGLTPELASRLTPAELAEIRKCFALGLRSLMDLHRVAAQPHVREAMGDLNAAVAFIMASPPQFGPSKWASLEAAEKLIKSYGRSQGVVFPKTHAIGPLVARANTLGLPPIHPALVKQLECDAGVRYGEIPVTKTEAVSAHQSSVEVVGHAAAAIIAGLPHSSHGQDSGS
jgi:HEPN domain.